MEILELCRKGIGEEAKEEEWGNTEDEGGEICEESKKVDGETVGKTTSDEETEVEVEEVDAKGKICSKNCTSLEMKVVWETISYNL